MLSLSLSLAFAGFVSAQVASLDAVVSSADLFEGLQCGNFTTLDAGLFGCLVSDAPGLCSATIPVGCGVPLNEGDQDLADSEFPWVSTRNDDRAGVANLGTTLDPTSTNSHLNIGEFASGLSGGLVGFLTPNSDMSIKLDGVIDSRTNYVFTTNYCTSNETTEGRLFMSVYVTSQDAAAIGAFANAPAGPSGTTLPTVSNDPTMPNLAVGDGYSDVADLVDTTPNATCGTLEVRFRHYELFSHVGIEGFGVKLSTSPAVGGVGFVGTVFFETSVTAEAFLAETGVDACTGVFLSEIDYLVDSEPEAGNVTTQAFEIVGPTGTDLEGYRIRSVASDGTVVFDETIDFSLVIPEAPTTDPHSPGFGHQVITVSGGLPDFGTDAHAIELYDGTTLLDSVCYGPEGASAPAGVACTLIVAVNGSAIEDMVGGMSLQRYGCGGCPADFDWELQPESHMAEAHGSSLVPMADGLAEGFENEDMYLCFDDGDGYWGGAQFYEFAGQVNSVPTFSCQCGGNDCQDTFGSIFPGAAEQCDGYLTNCTAVVDFGAADINSATGPQVDDARAATADGVGGDEADNDGDGRIDCDGDCRDGSALVADADGADSYGAASVVCDNVFYEDAADFPTADCGANEEVCDGVDNDCDGSFFADLVLHCPDLDNDGYGNCTVDATGNQNARLIPDCIVSPDGSLVNRTFPAFYAPSNDDCDDTAATINPGLDGMDYCTDLTLENGIDNDCDGLIDEDPDPQFDEDGDGFYDIAGNCTLATAGSASIIEEGMFDCNDTNPNVFPEAPEICDGFANNCTAENLGETYDRLDDDFDMDTYIECVADVDAVADGLFNSTAGFNLTALDCNDTDIDINPAAFDHVHAGDMFMGVFVGVGCDGIDNNCDGRIDEEFYGFDQDSDGFYFPHPVDGCATSDEFIGRLPRDCNDTDATIRPPTDLVAGFEELCDGKMNNCSLTALPDNEADEDGDGYVVCDPVEDNIFADVITGFIAGNDCNDTAGVGAGIHPGAADTVHSGGCDGIDNNCNDLIDEEFLGSDNDGDGFYFPHPINGCPTSSDPIGQLPRDCNDNDDTVYPEAPQLCDGQENDCLAVEAGGGVPTDETDVDGDGYVECEDWVGTDPTVNAGGDCDDTLATGGGINPGVSDTSLACDGIDNNCNGETDEEIGLDADDDGFLAANFAGGCATSDNVKGQNGVDCNDDDNLIFPGAPEICDGVKNDCDAVSMDGAEQDGDNDGFFRCQPVRFQYLDAGIDHTRADCDDTNELINPLQIDTCGDGLDNDCDGFADNVFVDFDGDNYPRETCATSNHPVASNTADCDDNDASVFPDAEEVCDGRVNTCGGTLPDDEVDGDNDGYMVCTAVEGALKLGGDCNDEDAGIKPGVTDPCDGVDNNCNGIVDENFTDADFDGAPMEANCVGPDGLVRAQDCDDEDPLQSPAYSDRDEQFQTAENGFTDGLDHDCNPNVVDAPNLELDVDTELENRKRSVLHKKHHHHHSSTSGSTSSSSSSYRGRRNDDSGANSDQTVVDVFVRITNNGGGNADNVVVKGQIVLPAGASFISRVFGTDDFSVRIDEDGDFIWLQNEVAAGSVAEITIRVLVNEAADEGDIRAVSRIERVEGFTPNVVAVL